MNAFNVPSIVLSAIFVLFHFTLTQLHEVRIIVCILSIRLQQVKFPEVTQQERGKTSKQTRSICS